MELLHAELPPREEWSESEGEGEEAAWWEHPPSAKPHPTPTPTPTPVLATPIPPFPSFPDLPPRTSPSSTARSLEGSGEGGEGAGEEARPGEDALEVQPFASAHPAFGGGQAVAVAQTVDAGTQSDFYRADVGVQCVPSPPRALFSTRSTSPASPRGVESPPQQPPMLPARRLSHASTTSSETVVSSRKSLPLPRKTGIPRLSRRSSSTSTSIMSGDSGRSASRRLLHKITPLPSPRYASPPRTPPRATSPPYDAEDAPRLAIEDVLLRYAPAIRSVFKLYSSSSKGPIGRGTTFDAIAKSSAVLNKAAFFRCITDFGIVGELLSKGQVEQSFRAHVSSSRSPSLDLAGFTTLFSRVCLLGCQGVPSLQTTSLSNGDRLAALFKRFGFDNRRRLMNTMLQLGFGTGTPPSALYRASPSSPFPSPAKPLPRNRRGSAARIRLLDTGGIGLVSPSV